MAAGIGVDGMHPYLPASHSGTSDAGTMRPCAVRTKPFHACGVIASTAAAKREVAPLTPARSSAAGSAAFTAMPRSRAWAEAYIGVSTPVPPGEQVNRGVGVGGDVGQHRPPRPTREQGRLLEVGIGVVLRHVMATVLSGWVKLRLP